MHTHRKKKEKKKERKKERNRESEKIEAAEAPDTTMREEGGARAPSDRGGDDDQ